MKHFSEYYRWALGVIDKSGIVQDRSSLHRQYVSRTEGIVRAPKAGGFAKPGASPAGLIFIDDAFLRFEERIVIERDGTIFHVFYTYHYQQPNGWYFRYDKLESPFKDLAKTVIEPQCHLHVAQNAPRFNTNATNLAEVLDLIKHNSYT
ncbi:MAG: hypothetical protein MAG451_00049 [Anaerolineales bacterium]|nr:hypothetical protein [Anaerolineales bacterium]